MAHGTIRLTSVSITKSAKCNRGSFVVDVSFSSLDPPKKKNNRNFFIKGFLVFYSLDNYTDSRSFVTFLLELPKKVSY